MPRRPHPDSEEALENAVLSQIFDQLLGWELVVAYSETLGPDGTLGRDSWDEVVLTRYLRDALQRFNPDAPAEAINLALEDLTRDLSTLTLASANREIYDLLKKGVRVTFRDNNYEQQVQTLQVIDWRNCSQCKQRKGLIFGADPAGHRLAQPQPQPLSDGVATVGLRRVRQQTGRPGGVRQRAAPGVH